MEQIVFIIDDEEPIRDALEMLISSVGLKVQSYDSAITFLDEFDISQKGCLILDIRMPMMSGLKLQDELIARNASLPIIFISGHGDIPMAVNAVKKGAQDFIAKPFNDQELLDCVQRTLRENEEVQEKLTAKQEISDRMDLLSERERQVMDLMVEGEANKVIAIDLAISQRTVEVHRANVMEKMAAASLAQLVKMVASLEI